MPCYRPYLGYVSRKANENGKFAITFNYRNGWIDRPVQVPCGKCIGCQKIKAASWAARIMQEASLYDDNCFITLTYNDQNLPEGGNLCKDDFVKFMKRLREHFNDKKIRFFQCGEYGTQGLRPHYHCVLFGFDFADRHYEVVNNRLVEVSDSLVKLWGKGFVTVGDLCQERASYVASYIVKKMKDAEKGIKYIGKVAPYATMSRGGNIKGSHGIGYKWFEKFKYDIYNSDKMVLKNGSVMRPPRYYDTKFSLTNPENFNKIKGMRNKKMLEHRYDERNRPRRLLDREKYQHYMLEKKGREDEAVSI